MKHTPAWVVVVLGLAVLAGVTALQLLDDAEDRDTRSSTPTSSTLSEQSFTVVPAVASTQPSPWGDVDVAFVFEDGPVVAEFFERFSLGQPGPVEDGTPISAADARRRIDEDRALAESLCAIGRTRPMVPVLCSR